MQGWIYMIMVITLLAAIFSPEKFLSLVGYPISNLPTFEFVFVVLRNFKANLLYFKSILFAFCQENEHLLCVIPK